MIVSRRVETDRLVFDPVLVDKEQATELQPFGIERVIGQPVGTDFVRFELQHPVPLGSSRVRRGGGPYCLNAIAV